MSRKEWALIGVVIGAGILLQIPGHDEASDHQDHDHAAHPHDVESRDASVMELLEAPEAGPYRTVALEVEGMT